MTRAAHTTIPTGRDPRPVGIVLAAGRGARLGLGPKAWVTLGGRSLAARAVDTCVAAGLRPLLVLPPLSRCPAPATDDDAACGLAGDVAACDVVHVPDGHDAWPSMAESFRAGVSAASALVNGAAGDPPPVAILLVDQPGITDAAVVRVLEHHRPGTITRAGFHGRPGHPVVLDVPDLVAAAASAEGDTAGRAYLAAHRARTVLVDCDDVARGEDLDTPRDLAAWRRWIA